MNLRKKLSKIYIPAKYFLFKISPKRFYPELIKISARIELGEKMDIENPHTYNEKLQWLKIHDSSAIKSKLTDKYEVREWVKKKIGEDYLIPFLGIWDRFEEINFDLLPNAFVLKGTHGCGCNLIVRDKNKFDYSDAKEKFHRWLKTNYAYFKGEIHYETIKPRILAEAYVENKNASLRDYKVFCFNGEPTYIMLFDDRYSDKKTAIYDFNWVRQEFVSNQYQLIDSDIEAPNNLNELYNVSKTLCKGFSFVRVDLYILNDGQIKFGEMTFTPAGGMNRWKPDKYNLILGEMIHLEEKT